MKEVVKKEIIKWLEAGIIYPIADSSWVSPIQCVPKKGGNTVIPSKDDELIPSKTVTGWRVCMTTGSSTKPQGKTIFHNLSLIKCWTNWLGKNIIAFLMVTRVTIRLLYTQMTRKKPHSHAPMELLLLGGCHSAYATHQVHSKGV